ncbi:hypothetical protein BJY52DRAFT_93453 [Lactarius psammicola]|nr:hypothetical protein BJY52DRAFT_93453 [Lactarius psammicola]
MYQVAVGRRNAEGRSGDSVLWAPKKKHVCSLFTKGLPKRASHLYSFILPLHRSRVVQNPDLSIRSTRVQAQRPAFLGFVPITVGDIRNFNDGGSSISPILLQTSYFRSPQKAKILLVAQQLDLSQSLNDMHLSPSSISAATVASAAHYHDPASIRTHCSSTSPCKEAGFAAPAPTPPSKPLAQPVPLEGVLPPGWELQYNPRGCPYDVNHNTRITTWTHPCPNLSALIPTAHAPSSLDITKTDGTHADICLPLG